MAEEMRIAEEEEAREQALTFRIQGSVEGLVKALELLPPIGAQMMDQSINPVEAARLMAEAINAAEAALATFKIQTGGTDGAGGTDG